MSNELEKEIAVSRLTAGVVGNEHSAGRRRLRWLTKIIGEPGAWHRLP
jgi:hypothetical protein